MIHKTCLKAGHRWGKPVRVDRVRFWLTIARCQRARCDRLRYEDDTGKVFTYDMLSDGSTADYKIVAK
jgi:hypothetical protein